MPKRNKDPGRPKSFLHPFRNREYQLKYDQAIRQLNQYHRSRWSGMVQIEHTKASYFARLSPEMLRRLEHHPVDPHDFVSQADKVEKDKLRPLISFFTTTFLQMSLYGHALEKGITKLGCGIIMSASPVDMLVMFADTSFGFRSNPEAEALIGDLKKCDAQHLETIDSFYFWVIETANKIASYLPHTLAEHFVKSVNLYVEYCRHLTIRFSLLGHYVELRQYFSTVTGSALTKVTNSVIVGGHLLVIKDCLIHIHDKLGISMGVSEAIDFDECLRSLTVRKRGENMLNNPGVQGDDLVSLCCNNIVRNVATKLLEVFNVELKPGQSPGSKFAVFLQHQIDVYGYRRFPARGMQSIMAREALRRQQSLMEYLQTNISMINTMEMRGATESTAWVLYEAVNQFLFGNRELLHLNKNCGGFGMLYPDGTTARPVTELKFREPNPIPRLPSSHLKIYESHQFCVEEDREFYKSVGLSYPDWIESQWYKDLVSTIHVRGVPPIPTALRKAALARFFQSVDMSLPINYGSANDEHAYWILHYIQYRWDPAIKALHDEGTKPSFGDNCPFLMFNQIVYGSAFRNVKAFSDFAQEWYHQRETGEYPACCDRGDCDRRCTSGVLLELGSQYLLPEKFAILRQIIEATSMLSSCSSVFFGMAEAQNVSEAFDLNKDFAYKEQNYLAAVYDAVGPQGRCIPPTIEENMQVLMNRFAKEVAWEVCSRHMVNHVGLYDRQMLMVDRGYAYLSWLVRNTLITLTDYRPEDIYVQGPIFRALQLGTLRQPKSLSDLIDDDDFFDGVCVSSSGDAKEYVITDLADVAFVGDGVIPKNRSIDLANFSFHQACKLRFGRMTKGI